jgi:hypothetical protein
MVWVEAEVKAERVSFRLMPCIRQASGDKSVGI